MNIYIPIRNALESILIAGLNSKVEGLSQIVAEEPANNIIVNIISIMRSNILT